MAMLPVNRIPEILKRMDLNTSQAEAMKTCFGILAIMSREDANKTLIAKDGMEIMLNAMTVHIDRTDVQEAGCDLLWSLAFNSNAVKEIIAKFNGAVVLVRALKRHSRSADFLKSACGALSNICQFRQNQEAVANQGGLQPLVGSIHVHQTNAKLLPFIFDAIASIIVNNEENARGVSSLGIIPIVVSSLSRHKSSKEVVKSGCHTLAILSDVKGQASKIAFAGGVPIILSLLDLHPHYSDLHRVAAVVLLRMLQESAHVGREICCNDGVRILLTSLEQGGAQQDTVAAVTHILYTITNPASPVVASIEPQLWHKPLTAVSEGTPTIVEGNSITAGQLPASLSSSFTASPLTALKGVITVLGQYATRRDVVRAACRLLTNLSGFENIPIALDHLSVLDRLFECVHHHQDAKDVMEASVTYLKLISKQCINKIPQFYGNHLTSFQGLLHLLKIRNHDEEAIYFATELLKKYLEQCRKQQRSHSMMAGGQPVSSSGTSATTAGPSGPTAPSPTHQSSNSGINILDNEDWCNKFLQSSFTTLENYTIVKENNNNNPHTTGNEDSNGNPASIMTSPSGTNLTSNVSSNNLHNLHQSGSTNNIFGPQQRVLKSSSKGGKTIEKMVGNLFILLEMLFMYGKLTPSSSITASNDGSGGATITMKLFQLVHKIQYPTTSENHHHQQALEFLLNYYHRLINPLLADIERSNSPSVSGKVKVSPMKFTNLTGEEGYGLAATSRDISPLKHHAHLLSKSHSNGEILIGSARKMSRNPSLVTGLTADEALTGNALTRQPSKLIRDLSSTSLLSSASNPNPARNHANHPHNNNNNTHNTNNTHHQQQSHPHTNNHNQHGNTPSSHSSSGNNSNECAYLRNNKYYPKHPCKPEIGSPPPHHNTTNTPSNNPTNHLHHNHINPHTTPRLLENWPNFIERLLTNNSTNGNFPAFRNNSMTSTSLPGVGPSLLFSSMNNMPNQPPLPMPVMIDSSTELPSRMHLCYESIRPGGLNIASRCATPVPYLVPPGGIGRPFEHSLTFESEFESGNLLRAVQVGDASYDLLLRADVHTVGHTQWFYFAVSNTHPLELVKLSEQGVNVPSVRVTFSIVNFTKPDSLFNLGMRPVVYSIHDAKSKNIGWIRSGTDISYRSNSFQRNNTAGEGVNSYYTLSFTLEFHHPKDTVLIAYSYPYTMTDYRLLISDILSNKRHSDHYIKKFKLCTTLGGEDCDLLVITDYTTEKEKIGPINVAVDLDMANTSNNNGDDSGGNTTGKKGKGGGASSSNNNNSNNNSSSNANNSFDTMGGGGGGANRRYSSGQLKPALFLSGRVHPGETPASWMMKGIIEFLTSDNASAKLLRKLFVIFIVPVLNPDGIILGNNRCSLAGVDLNRQWKQPLKNLHPTIYSLKSFLLQQKKIRDIVMYIDLHGHSRKYNVFMYGCDDKKRLNTTISQSNKTRLFPRLLSSHNIGNKYINYNDCSFSIKKGRESTARVVVAKEMNIFSSYTLEATFCGCNYGPLKNCHLNIGHLQEIGAAVCDAFLQYSLSEGYGKNVVHVMGPITTTDYQVSNLLQYDPNHINHHLNQQQQHQQHLQQQRGHGTGGLDNSGSSTALNSENNSRRNSGTMLMTVGNTATEQRGGGEGEGAARFSDQQSVAQDDSESDDDKNDADNTSLCEGIGGEDHHNQISSTSNLKQGGETGTSSSTTLTQAQNTSLYHQGGNAHRGSNKIDLALSIIQSETHHPSTATNSASDVALLSHRSSATAKSGGAAPNNNDFLKSQSSKSHYNTEIQTSSSAPPSATATASSMNHFFYDNNPTISITNPRHQLSTAVHGSIVWDTVQQDDYNLRPKPSSNFESVSDVVTKRLSGTNAGTNNASTSLNFMVTNTKGQPKGQSHMDKPKPSNVSSSLNAANRMKLVHKTLDISSSAPRSSTSSPNPTSFSISSTAQVSPRGTGELLSASELKGNGATIFKSEYSDLFLPKQATANSSIAAGLPLYHNQPHHAASVGTSDSNLAKDIAIATPFGLPRVNGAQSK
mmetsp:Transcript_30046/g.32736  ORF Transcript_30046/g.32736 Transcript_30046/m.32736 type:complete len:2016 (+) Transcript_30046:56-6103(+)